MTPSSDKTVLVVDDEEDVVKFLKMALEDAGFNVTIASNGVEALERIKEKVPDLISLDIVMPKGSGVKFHRELKKNDEWSKIPILVVTGHAKDDLGKDDLEEMTMSGPGVYLEKPVTAEKYVDAVNKVLGMPEQGNQGESGNVKNEVKSLIDSADTETLNEILKKLKSKN